MKKNLFLMALALLLAVPASAQFNIGKLVDQGKKKLEKKAKKAVDNVVGGQVQQASDALPFNPVASRASNPSSGVDDSLFPYDRKSFANAGVYLDGTEKVENYLLYIYVNLCKALNSSLNTAGITVNGCIPACPDGKVLAYGEPVVNAFFYDYMQKPNDYKNFRQMIKAYVIAQKYYYGFLKQSLVDGSETQMKDSEGKVQTLWEAEKDRRFRGYQLMRAAEALAQQSDYSNIFDGTYSCLTQADKAYKEGNTEAAYNNYREFFTAWDNFLTQHPQWKSDGRAGQFTQMLQEAQKRELELRDKVIDDNKTPQDMPQTYKAIPGVEAKVRMCIGREDPEHKNAPVVFLSNGWRPLYRSGSTSVIDQRAVDVGWTYTDANGQKWLAYTTLMQKAVYKGATVTYLDSYMFSGGFKTMKLK